MEVIILLNEELSIINSSEDKLNYDWGYPIIKETEEFIKKYNELKAELKRLEFEQSTT